jgi:hypothetical protein
MSSWPEIKYLTRDCCLPVHVLNFGDMQISLSSKLAAQYGGDWVIPHVISVTLPPIEQKEEKEEDVTPQR